MRLLRPVLLLLILGLPAVVQAQFTHTTNNGKLTITGYTGPGGAVAIPDTINGLPVTRIGAFAFYGHLTVTSVTIPNSVTNIGEAAFRYCTSLSAITVDTLNSFYSSMDGVLFNKSQTLLIKFPEGKAGSYEIPNSVTSIGGIAFEYCTSLASVAIPNSVTNIEASAFWSCTSLINVRIPNSVTSIGATAFAYCTNLTSVTIDNGVTSIRRAAFHSCTSLTSATIPDSVTNIGDSTFENCPSLSSVTIPNGVTSIERTTFYSCTSLTSVTIPNSVTSIGDSAFSCCASLSSVTIPNSITSIGSSAFFSCSNLISVTIGNQVTSIGAAPFAHCTSLSAITVDALNSVYSSLDGVLFNNGQTVLIQCPGGKAGSYIIPNSVTSIADQAFAGCTSLSSVRIPNSVTSIGNSAFYSCTSLTSITIPNSVASIGYGAFYSCTSLTSVTIPNSVTSIGDGAFSSCTSLTGVYFQGSVPSGANFSLFFGAINATVYYLPGTTGWGTTFGGRPTVLWNPLVATGDASFGVRANRFGFNITADKDLVILVVASTNLTNPDWIPVATNALFGGSSYFSDPQWTNHPSRFYRLRSP